MLPLFTLPFILIPSSLWGSPFHAPCLPPIRWAPWSPIGWSILGIWTINRDSHHSLLPHLYFVALLIDLIVAVILEDLLEPHWSLLVDNSSSSSFIPLHSNRKWRDALHLLSQLVLALYLRRWVKCVLLTTHNRFLLCACFWTRSSFSHRPSTTFCRVQVIQTSFFVELASQFSFNAFHLFFDLLAYFLLHELSLLFSCGYGRYIPSFK